jgi:hypothetical protein
MSEDMCAVCYEPLGVPGYIELPDKDIQIEGNCTRLGCGHALHSLCVAQSLQAYKGKCVLCNVRNLNQQFDSAEDRLKFEGTCMRVLQQIKKVPTVRESLRDYNAFERELTKKKTEFRNRVREYKNQLRKDMKVDVLVKDVKRCRTVALRYVKKEAIKNGTIYGAAIAQLSPWNIDRWLFGFHRWNYNAYYNSAFY